jgi:hypothetical protein
VSEPYEASTEPADDDTIEIEVRPAREIALRAIALVTVTRRGWLEVDGDVDGELDEFERETDRFELYTWARKELESVLTATERNILKTPVGSLPEEWLDVCAQSSLAANALGWTLQVRETLQLSDRESMTISEELVTWAPEPWNSVHNTISDTTHRSEDEVARQREIWELWYWRATLANDHLDAEDMESAIRDTAAEVARVGLIDVIEHDFEVDGLPFAGLDDDRQVSVAILAEANLLALNWVCGFGNTWDDTPVFPD